MSAFAEYKAGIITYEELKMAVREEEKWDKAYYEENEDDEDDEDDEE